MMNRVAISRVEWCRPSILAAEECSIEPTVLSQANHSNLQTVFVICTTTNISVWNNELQKLIAARSYKPGSPLATVSWSNDGTRDRYR